VSGAGGALQAAAIEALATLGLGAVYPGPPLRAAFPYAAIECGAETDWGHKGGRGRELRLAVTWRDSGERPERALALGDAAEAAIEAGLEPEGWQVVSLALLRRRTVAAGPPGQPGWIVALDYRVRMLAG
jgi:hypothetical protein